MRNRVFLAVLSVSVWLAGCSPMFDVNSRHDPEADFASYATYDLMDNSEMDMSVAASEEFAGRRRVMAEELVKALNRNMQALGFEQDAGNPDILVAYYVGVRDEVFAAQFGFDYNDLTGAAAVQSVRDGAVRVDFVDAELKRVVWTAEGHGAVNRDPSEEIIRTNVNKAIDKLLKQYPPKKGSRPTATAY